MSSSLGRAAAVALAGAALLSGCGGDDDDRAQRTPARPAATPTATPTPPAPRAKTVRFTAPDGESVSARYTTAGKHAPAVVLMHEIRGSAAQWDPLVPDLHAAGYSTLAYESRSSWLERERLPDVLAAVRWLRARPDVDPRRLALVGASIGASTAVYAMATGARRTFDAAVALSPPDSGDIWKLQDAGRYRPHDLLLVSDDREAPSAESMLDGAVRSKAIRSARPGHGVDLLPDPGVRRALLAWLDEHVAR